MVAVNHRILMLLLWCLVIVFLSSSSLSNSTVTDIFCVQKIKQSLKDPNGYLNSWDFSNKTTQGFICRFAGVECWHPDEDKVLNLRLSEFGLQGKFPRGIKKCTSLTGLDLSGNNFSGPIPSDISKILQFVTSLDLSSNSFSGTIPASLADCVYLNILKLDNNRLTGQIPLQLGQLSRIKTFNVSNNLLSGPVPRFSNDSIAPAESYAHNLGLCGGPLKPCAGKQRLT